MNNDIGETITRLRKENKLTQKELANQIGVSDKVIAKWENGVYLPDLQILPSLAKALNVEISYLLGATDNKGSVKNNSQNMDTKNLVTFIFQVVSLAMGIAIIVLNILNKLELKEALTMLGIGLIGLSISSLLKDKTL